MIDVMKSLSVSFEATAVQVQRQQQLPFGMTTKKATAKPEIKQQLRLQLQTAKRCGTAVGLFDCVD
jgi:hypothetical protein